MLTQRQINTKEKLLEGRKCAGNLGVQEFLELLEREILYRDATYELHLDTLAKAFNEFAVKWFNNLPTTNDEIAAAYQWDGYLAVLYECFVNWTFRTTALSINFLKQFDLVPNELLMYADGFGAASFMVATAFPQTKVTCHVMGDRQYNLAEVLVASIPLSNLELTRDARSLEAVFAFESFEHFTNPTQVAAPIIEKTDILIYTAPWSIRAHGHFPTYEGIPAEDYSRHFTKFLRNNGFIDSQKALGFRFFNSYPRVNIRVQPNLPVNAAAQA